MTSASAAKQLLVSGARDHLFFSRMAWIVASKWVTNDEDGKIRHAGIDKNINDKTNRTRYNRGEIIQEWDDR